MQAKRGACRWTGSGKPRGHAWILLCSLALAAGSASAASLKEVTGFGDNPSNIRMYLYVPDKVQAHPPVLVGLLRMSSRSPYGPTGYMC